MSEKKKRLVQINSRELATILAALREWHTLLGESWGEDVKKEYEEHFVGTTPLSLDEIDALCQRINFPDEDIAEMIETLDNVAASLDTTLAWFGGKMTQADLDSRGLHIKRARRYVRKFREPRKAKKAP